jgi:DNA-binding NtrC family response regulator
MDVMNQLSGKSILVVEDDPGMLRALDKVLRGEGASVTTAGWAAEAVEILTKRERVFDLVITDLRMPFVTGVTLVYAIHAIFPKLPVIVLTAFGSPDVRDECRKQGAAAFLEKPLDSEALTRTICDTLGLTAQEPRSVEEGAPSTNRSREQTDSFPTEQPPGKQRRRQ